MSELDFCDTLDRDQGFKPNQIPVSFFPTGGNDYSSSYSTVGFIMTTNCPVGCRHCITGKVSCPEPSPDSYRRWIQSVSESCVIRKVCLTGGEPFFVYNTLMDVVEVIRKHGMRPSVMTSAYWARSDVATEKLLTPLVHAGLDGLGVSVDEFHQEKVPLQNVLRAIRTAKRLGLWVGVAFRYYGRDESAKEAACELRDILGEVFEDVDIVSVGPIQKEGQASQQVEFTQQHLEKQGKIINCGPFSPTIWPDGTVSSCCGPRLSERNPLVIGNLNYEPFTEIYQRFREHPIIPFLEVLGLTKMVEELNDNGLGGNLKDFVAPEETCSLCQKMLTNVTYIDFFVKKFRDPAFRRQLGVRRFLLYGNPWPLLSTEGEKERK